MKYEISKELFEAVRKDINGVVSIDTSKQEIDNCFKVNYKKNFGLFHYDEFFFKCKEWALKQGYDINSGYSHHLIDYTPKGYYCWIKHKKSQSVEMYRKLSEQQSVFDACMYILKEINK